jgi:hypothetical protein
VPGAAPIPDQAAGLDPRLGQGLSQPGTDVAGRPGDQRSHRGDAYSAARAWAASTSASAKQLISVRVLGIRRALSRSAQPRD